MTFTPTDERRALPVSDVTSSISTTSASIKQLLKEQYQCTEDYCNASTALYNALQQQSQPNIGATQRSQVSYSVATEMDTATILRKSVGSYQESLLLLQSNVRKLEQLVATLEGGSSIGCSIDKTEDSAVSSFLRLLNFPVIHEHLECSRRVLGTIYQSGVGTSYHSNGLLTPKPISDATINIKLVALATLRASIQTVNESLPP
jgi:hypothetical protein